MFQDGFKWIGPDPLDNNLFEADELLRASFPLLDNLEIYCMAACCGIGAFSFEKADILTASKELDKETLIGNLQAAIEELKKRPEKTVVSSRLNNLFEKSTFIHLLEHTITILRETN